MCKEEGKGPKTICRSGDAGVEYRHGVAWCRPAPVICVGPSVGDWE
jgi:hypothetical protein